MGVPAGPTHGASVFLPDRPRHLVVWAGHMSRTTTSCYGALTGADKIMLDLVTDRCFAADWEDRDVRLLAGPERRRAEALVTSALRRLGLD